MNLRNLGVLAVAVVAMVFAFYSGGYAQLHSLIFIAGLCVAVVISAHAAVKMETLPLAVFLVAATLLAIVDEYAHTAAGTLMYFDHGVPSLLTVTGWGIFMLVMLAAARLVLKLLAKVPGLADKSEGGIVRVLPAFVPCVLIALAMPLFGYLPLLTPMLAAVFLLLAVAALYYTSQKPPAWNAALLIAGVGTGLLMEYLGALEGAWTFHYGEPVSIVILITWPLRVWTVLCLCLLLGYDICGPQGATDL